MLRGVRGATTVNSNEPDDIIEKTYELLTLLIDKNGIQPTDVSSVIITVTTDLNAEFPAKAMRKLKGWTYVPVMCMTEIPVPHALEKCIRVMIHTNTDIPQHEIAHMYLHKAKGLRPDLEEERKRNEMDQTAE
ncbi:chorismate mutase [Bacillus carboniphilus]|uniref:chorismate mutase n=1 Tax=Bacillus carboniphilus TaxID=86663 RepID=A0ABP3GJT0_9BACI